MAEEPVPADTGVEAHIHAMDKDHDGMVTMAEIRFYLESRNGKGYEKKLLDELEMKAGSKSCASPFTRSLY